MVVRCSIRILRGKHFLSAFHCRLTGTFYNFQCLKQLSPKQDVKKQSLWLYRQNIFVMCWQDINWSPSRTTLYPHEISHTTTSTSITIQHRRWLWWSQIPDRSNAATHNLYSIKIRIWKLSPPTWFVKCSFVLLLFFFYPPFPESTLCMSFTKCSRNRQLSGKQLDECCCVVESYFSSLCVMDHWSEHSPILLHGLEELCTLFLPARMQMNTLQLAQTHQWRRHI